MNKYKKPIKVVWCVSRTALLVVSLIRPMAGQAATYSFVDLNPNGAPASVGYGISVGQQVGSGNNHALVWSGTAGSVVDLNPNGFTSSAGYGGSGGQQVGWASGPSSGNLQHAYLWSGTPSSGVDLNPDGFTWSFGRANSDSQQIGYGYGSATGGNQHALLWSGSAGTVIDLNPSGFTQSFGERIFGDEQVGNGSGPSTGNQPHALLWFGSASSVLDLNPDGFTASGALGMSGNQQVGYGYGPSTGNNMHAILWSGSSASAVDLNPNGFTTSVASGISGTRQVGYGSGPATGNNNHALLWTGSASSAVDLHNFLSSDYSFSIAEGIDASGNVIGFAHFIPTGQEHAILWIATILEPGVPSGHLSYRFSEFPIWDISGQYVVIRNGFTITEFISHSPKGKITGSRSDFYSQNQVQIEGYGYVKGVLSSGTDGIVIRKTGKSIFNGMNATLTTSEKALIVPSSLTLQGQITLRSCANGHCSTTYDNYRVPMVTGMNGNWGLDLSLSALGNKLSGTGKITLSNGRALSYTVSGRYDPRKNTSSLRLNGQLEAAGTYLSFTLPSVDLIPVTVRGKLMGQKISFR